MTYDFSKIDIQNEIKIEIKKELNEIMTENGNSVIMEQLK